MCLPCITIVEVIVIIIIIYAVATEPSRRFRGHFVLIIRSFQRLKDRLTVSIPQ